MDRYGLKMHAMNVETNNVIGTAWKITSFSEFVPCSTLRLTSKILINSLDVRSILSRLAMSLSPKSSGRSMVNGLLPTKSGYFALVTKITGNTDKNQSSFRYLSSI